MDRFLSNWKYYRCWVYTVGSFLSILALTSACPTKSVYGGARAKQVTSPLGIIIHQGQKNKCPVNVIAKWERELVALWIKAEICKSDPGAALKGKSLKCSDTPKIEAPDGRTVNGWATNLRMEISWDGNIKRTKSLFFHEGSHIIAYSCDEDVDHYLFRLLRIDACGGSCND